MSAPLLLGDCVRFKINLEPPLSKWSARPIGLVVGVYPSHLLVLWLRRRRYSSYYIVDLFRRAHLVPARCREVERREFAHAVQDAIQNGARVDNGGEGLRPRRPRRAARAAR